MDYTGRPKTIPVCTICLTTQTGGIDRVIRDWVSGAQDCDINPIVVVRDVDEIVNSFRSVSSNLRLLRFRLGRRRVTVFSELAVALKLAKLVRKFRRMVLNPHDYLSLGPCLLAERLASGRHVLVATVHTLLDRAPGKGRLRWMTRAVERAALRRADHIIAVSEGRKRELLEKFSATDGAVTVVHNGVDLARFCGRTIPRNVARRAFGIPADALALGFAGRLSPEKGILELISSVEMLPIDLRQRAYLLIAGTGALSREVTEQAATRFVSGRALIKPVGFLPDLRLFYRALDLLVLPSWNEGLSVTLLESMAMGLPSVATAIGGTSEAVIDGESGWLVATPNPRDLLPALTAALASASELKRRGEAARARAETHFSLRQMIIRTNEVLRSTWLRE